MQLSIKIIHWTPRIICIAAILFISIFAADAFEAGLTIWQQLANFILHLTPFFVLIVLLLIAWKWEFIGGILFLITGIITIPLIFIHNYKINHLSINQCLGIISVINFPFIIVGILFIFSYYRKKKYLILLVFQSYDSFKNTP